MAVQDCDFQILKYIFYIYVFFDMHHILQTKGAFCPVRKSNQTWFSKLKAEHFQRKRTHPSRSRRSPNRLSISLLFCLQLLDLQTESEDVRNRHGFHMEKGLQQEQEDL